MSPEGGKPPPRKKGSYHSQKKEKRKQKWGIIIFVQEGIREMKSVYMGKLLSKRKSSLTAALTMQRRRKREKRGSSLPLSRDEFGEKIAQETTCKLGAETKKKGRSSPKNGCAVGRKPKGVARGTATKRRWP